MSPPFNVFPLVTTPPALFLLLLFSLSICFSSFSTWLVQGHNGSIQFQNTMLFVTGMPSLSLLLGHSPFALVSEYGRSQCVTHFVSQPAHSFPWSLCLYLVLFCMSAFGIVVSSLWHRFCPYLHTHIATSETTECLRFQHFWCVPRWNVRKLDILVKFLLLASC